MNNPVPYITQGDNLVLMIDNSSHNISKASHKNYEKILDAIREENWDLVVNLVDMVRNLSDYLGDKCEIKNGELYWDGNKFHNALSTRILDMHERGFPIGSMVKFMKNLMKNPSAGSVQQLYGFLESSQLPITHDGHFLAYKRVKVVLSSDKNFNKGDMIDIYSGTIRNNVGDICKMSRNLVNDCPDVVCSTGLHFASMEYLSSSKYGAGNPILVLKINPKHVVSIPIDYNHQKGRTCKYKVIGIHGVDSETGSFDIPVVDDVELYSQ